MFGSSARAFISPTSEILQAYDRESGTLCAWALNIVEHHIYRCKLCGKEKTLSAAALPTGWAIIPIPNTNSRSSRMVILCDTCSVHLDACKWVLKEAENAIQQNKH